MRLKKGLNKRGWIRITEAVVAILIMASVLIVLYTSEPQQVSYSDYVYDLQVRLLMDVADSASLRNATLYSNGTQIDDKLIEYFNNSVPLNFNYTIYVCNLNATSCNIKIDTTREIMVEDRIISSNLQKYDPKLLRLYIWEKG
ncbi:MAG: hypothetical protein WCI72_05210 [archaeon]